MRTARAYSPGEHSEAGAGSRLATCCSVVGIGGSILCSISMVAAAVGLFASSGAVAAKGAGSSMAGMSGTGPGSTPSHGPGWPGTLWVFLIRFGPEILIVSIIILTIAVALRRREAAIPALLGGVILYAGMYAQPILAWMYVAMVVGTSLLLLAYLASRHPSWGWNAGREGAS